MSTSNSNSSNGTTTTDRMKQKIKNMSTCVKVKPCRLATIELSYNDKKVLCVVITEDYKLMVHREELFNTTEYLTLQA